MEIESEMGGRLSQKFDVLWSTKCSKYDIELVVCSIPMLVNIISFCAYDPFLAKSIAKISALLISKCMRWCLKWYKPHAT